MPENTARRRRLLALASLLVVMGAAAPWLYRQWLWRLELNPHLRGRIVAEEAGCLVCHGTLGSREIPNPGSRWGSIPRFAAGNAAMYEPSRAGVEEFIRHGAPLAWLEDPQVAARLAEQQIRMPAYEGRLSERAIADLVTYVTAVEGVELPGSEVARQGRALAREHGCLGCHGVEGAGGEPNPGSIGGFVPGFLGGNFPKLVKDRAEFEEWIRTGTSQRLAANPVVRPFWRRQTLLMPAYEESLDEAEIDALWQWIVELRDGHG